VQRFFFHFWSKSQGYPDDIGREVHSLKAAHRHALKLIDGVLSFRGMADEEPRWVVKIADGQGRIVLTILFPQRRSAPNPSWPTAGGSRPLAPPTDPASGRITP
jgi:hypothetical protein